MEEVKTSMKEITREEVRQHDRRTDCWIILGNNTTGGAKVYDITNYISEHPGGPEVLIEFAGRDADGIFEEIGHSNSARRLLQRFEIGIVKSSKAENK